MIELNAQTLISPDIFSLIPTLEGPTSAESTTSSTPIAQDFSALLTELMGPVDAPAVHATESVKAVGAPIAAQTAEQPAALPEIPLPEAALPKIPMPEVAVPKTAVPEAALPKIPMPEVAVPKTAVPEQALAEAPQVPEVVTNEPKGTELKNTKEQQKKDNETVLNSTPVCVVPFVPLAANAPVAVENERGLQPATKEQVAAREQVAPGFSPFPNTPKPQPEIERAWADVRKFEFKVQHEAARPAEVRPAQAAQVAPAASAALKQAMVTSDPIANTQQEQLPPRVLAIQKVTIETGLAEREAKRETATPSTDTTSTAPVQFNDVARSIGSGAPAEQIRPAHYVEIPNLPHVQVVRTVAMEVGDADSQVVIHIQERGGDVSLQLNAMSEPLRQELQSSLGSLVHALRREDVQVSGAEVSRKPPIDKVRRMKEAR